MYGSDTLYSQSMNGIRIITDGLATLQGGVLTANNIKTGTINANAIHTDLISQTEMNTLEGIRTDVTIQQQFDAITVQIDETHIPEIDARLDAVEVEIVALDSRIDVLEADTTTDEHAVILSKIKYRPSDDTTLAECNMLIEKNCHVNDSLTAAINVLTDDVVTNTLSAQFIKLKNNNLRPIIAFLYFNLQFSVPLFQSCSLMGFIPSGFSVTSAHIIIIANFNAQFCDVNGKVLQTIKANYNTMQTVNWNVNMHNVKLFDRYFVEL